MNITTSLVYHNHINRLKFLSRFFTVLVAMLGTFVLLGWYLDIEVFKRPLANMVAMNPLTAISFILSALSLFMLTAKKKSLWNERLGYILAALVLTAAILKLFSVIFGIDAHFDSLLFHDKLNADVINNVNNRMAPNTALGFVFVGIALLFCNIRVQKNQMPSHYVVMLVGLLGTLSVLGYMYQVHAFYGFLTYIPMAIHTAIGFLLIALAILFTHPEKGIMSEFTRTEVGAITARRLIPAAIIIPVILGFIGICLEWHRFVSEELGVTVLVLGNMIIFLGLIWFNIRELNKKDDISMRQKALLEEKNKDILDSITYAKRLQDAIIPPIQDIKKILPESFILYKPKDIVAGDFYWMWNETMPGKASTIFIAACDCTGHGVPGAMVSIVCSNALYRAVKEFGMRETGKILDKAREIVLETFEKSVDDVQDGMDISLCSINTDNYEIQWSGANTPLWYIQGQAVKEITADKQSIGKHTLSKPFTTHFINLQKGDTLYLFTDGFADQFGGEKGKKFKYSQFMRALLTHKHHPLEKQKDILHTIFTDWKMGLEQVDDVLVMGIRV